MKKNCYVHSNRTRQENATAAFSSSIVKPRQSLTSRVGDDGSADVVVVVDAVLAAAVDPEEELQKGGREKKTQSKTTSMRNQRVSA